MFIVPGVLNWIYCLYSLSGANVLFIYSAVGSLGEAPAGGLAPGGRSPLEAGAF